MKITAKEQIRIANIKGEYVDVAPGQTVEVADRIGSWEIAAGRATDPNAKKKEADPAKQ